MVDVVARTAQWPTYGGARALVCVWVSPCVARCERESDRRCCALWKVCVFVSAHDGGGWSRRAETAGSGDADAMGWRRETEEPRLDRFGFALAAPCRVRRRTIGTRARAHHANRRRAPAWATRTPDRPRAVRGLFLCARGDDSINRVWNGSVHTLHVNTDNSGFDSSKLKHSAPHARNILISYIFYTAVCDDLRRYCSNALGALPFLRQARSASFSARSSRALRVASISGMNSVMSSTYGLFTSGFLRPSEISLNGAAGGMSAAVPSGLPRPSLSAAAGADAGAAAAEDDEPLPPLLPLLLPPLLPPLPLLLPRLASTAGTSDDADGLLQILDLLLVLFLRKLLVEQLLGTASQTLKPLRALLSLV